MQSSKNIGIRILIPLVLVAFFYVSTNRVYHLPFSDDDDQRALAMAHPEKSSFAYKTAMYGQNTGWLGSLAIDWHMGRFRPVCWTWYKLLSILYGDNATLYRFNNLIVLFLSCFFLLSILLFFEVDILSSFLVMAIYVFGRNNEIFWTLLPPSQNIGECFLLAGIYVWLKYRQSNKTGYFLLPALLFFLSAMDKECFILCIPVLLLTDYYFYNPKPRLFSKEYWFSALAFLIPIVGLIITILTVGKVYSYDYPDSKTYILAYNVFQFLWGAVFLVGPIMVWLAGRKLVEPKKLTHVFIVFILWGVLQLILLRGIKLDIGHHYLIPWLIYPLIITALSFKLLKNSFPNFFRVMIVLYGAVGLLFIKNTYINSSSYAASVDAYYKMIDTIKQNPGPKIIYLTEGACVEGWMSGTRVILDNMGINAEMDFCSITNTIPEWENGYAHNPSQNAFKHIQFNADMFLPDGKWILILGDALSKNGMINHSFSLYKSGNESYLKAKDTVIDIPGKYYYFSMPYRDVSLSDILHGDFSHVNYEGFYAIKLNNK